MSWHIGRSYEFPYKKIYIKKKNKTKGQRNTGRSCEFRNKNQIYLSNNHLK
jgi:hypothetical protein